MRRLAEVAESHDCQAIANQTIVQTCHRLTEQSWVGSPAHLQMLVTQGDDSLTQGGLQLPAHGTILRGWQSWACHTSSASTQTPGSHTTTSTMPMKLKVRSAQTLLHDALRQI